MFSQRQTELRQRQLALRLRNIELRAELRAGALELVKPIGWLGLAGSAASAAVVVAGLRKPGRLLKLLGLAKLGLRLARLFRSLSA